MNDILTGQIRNAPPSTQEDVCLLAARTSIAALGPVSTNGEIRDAARGIAEGVFGEAWIAADRSQRVAWLNMCDRAYRTALSASSPLAGGSS